MARAAELATGGAVDAVAGGPEPPVDRGATLEPPGPPLDAGLKWPNDLELGGRKAAGLLAEAHLDGAGLGCVLLGMGVNVTQGPQELPPALAGRATSVALAAGGPGDPGAPLGARGGRFAAR